MKTKYKLIIGEDDMINYKYGTEHFACSFSLFCEVGQPYQQWFKDEIRRRNLTIETKELNEYPWIADFVVKKGGNK